MSVKQELHRLVDLLDVEREEPALEYRRWFLSEDDVLFHPLPPHEATDVVCAR